MTRCNRADLTTERLNKRGFQPDTDGAIPVSHTTRIACNGLLVCSRDCDMITGRMRIRSALGQAMRETVHPLFECKVFSGSNDIPPELQAKTLDPEM
jgi:hypothetical protein